MTKKPFTPNFKTQPSDFCKEELNKINSNGMLGALSEDLQDPRRPDLAWEAEQLAKSYGIYLEFNRAKTGTEKEWIYMLRVSNPAGGPITRKQWQIFDELSEKYTAGPDGHPSLRLTTRQNIQLHWIKKKHVKEIVRRLAQNDLRSLNGCGDNTRNVMSCPLSGFSDIFNAHKWAQKCGEYFQLPLDPFIEVFAIDPKNIRRPEESFAYAPNLLNRKFKIAFSSVHRDPVTQKLIPDNCVELRTHDLAVAPVIEQGKVHHYQIYIGGGQGERNGKPSIATLGLPFCKVKEDQLLTVLDAVVKVHQEWGDRQNRVWARLKYVIKKKGLTWYRGQVSALVGFPLEDPDPEHDYGCRHLHFGWWRQPSNGLWSYGVFIENGRITDDSPNGRLKTMVREVMNTYPVELMVTPNQDIVFTNIPEDAKEAFEASLKHYQYGQRNGRPYSRLRLMSGACVGRDTCRLTYTDSEKFEPYLIDELEKLGWGDFAESIGVTGCERQCFRPATKTVGLVGSGMDRYQLKLMGSEDARHQGLPLISGDGQHMYLRSIPKERVAGVLDVLFAFYKEHAGKNESMGCFHRRSGMEQIIRRFKDHPSTSDLMAKPFNTDCIID